MAVGSGDVKRIVNAPVISEIANDKYNIGIARPNGPGDAAKLLPVGVIDALFVANFQLGQMIRTGMAVGGPAPTPRTVRRAVDVFNEVGHGRGRFVAIDIGHGQDAGGLAEIKEIENAPAVGGARIPPAF